MRKVLGIGLLCAALAPLPGAAADAWYDGLYVGSGVGAARLEADLPDLGLLPRNSAGIPESIESTDFKKTALTGKFFVGYRPFKYLGIEVGFAKLNDVSRQYCFVDTSGECTETRGTPIPPTSSTATTSSAWTVELDTEAWSVTAVGLYPFNDTVEVFAKAGVVDWETDVAAFEKIVGGFVPPKDPLVPPTNVPVAGDLDGTDFATALGVNFNHSSGVTIRSEFEYYDIGDLDQSYILSLSAIYNF